ncbi:Sensor protein rcsC [Hordeum vulgare]|nr:Sensor protein rcsC [Hordeum vulgare]
MDNVSSLPHKKRLCSVVSPNSEKRLRKRSSRSWRSTNVTMPSSVRDKRLMTLLMTRILKKMQSMTVPWPYWKRRALRSEKAHGASLQRERSLVDKLGEYLKKFHPETLAGEFSAMLKRADYFLHLILQSAPIVIAHQDVELRYRYIFNHFPTLADEDVIGKTDHEILSGEGIDEMNKVKREVKTREKIADIRVREAVQKAKETKHSRSPNITEDTPQEKQMLATMSHEIGSPLSEVLRIVELLATTKLGQEQHQLLELMLSSGNVVLPSIDGILGLSKVESGVIKLQSAIFRPREVVEHVLQTASSFMKKELTLEGRIGDYVPLKVIGDALKIQEILTNLISEYYIGLTTEIPVLGEGQRWSRAEAWVV